MDKEIKDIVDKYKDDNELKKFSNKYYSEFVYSEPIKTKQDMNKATMGLDATLNYFDEFEKLSNDDIEVMERRVAEYELAVFKLLNNIDETTEYTAYDLRMLTEHISQYYKQLESLNKKERTLESQIGYNF